MNGLVDDSVNAVNASASPPTAPARGRRGEPVAFDLDRSLPNSLRDIVLSFQYAFRVQGSDGFAHKPAPDVIYRALNAVDGEGVWMVGDTASDVEAGRAVGLRTYAVIWGTQDAEALCHARPDVLSHDLNGLLELT